MTFWCKAHLSWWWSVTPDIFTPMRLLTIWFFYSLKINRETTDVSLHRRNHSRCRFMSIFEFVAGEDKVDVTKDDKQKPVDVVHLKPRGAKLNQIITTDEQKTYIESGNCRTWRLTLRNKQKQRISLSPAEKHKTTIQCFLHRDHVTSGLKITDLFSSQWTAAGLVLLFYYVRFS